MLVARYIEERRPGHLTRTVVGDGVPTITFDMSGDYLPAPLKRSDFVAIALIFLAMRRGVDLHIRGAVSTELLTQLEEFQEVWASWCPKKYRQVRITADDEVSSAAPHRVQREGVFAISGGVDSLFTLASHVDGRAGRRSVRPSVAVLVHGFDIPVTDEDSFKIAHDAVRRAAIAMQLPLTTVRTNWRSAVVNDWESEFFTGLAAVLHQFAGGLGFGVLGADEDYSHLALPWGSNPITNHLLGSPDFELVSEGGNKGRTERVADLVVHNSELAALVRVCWEGNASGENCGVCEKCVRTQLNFLAVGAEPVAFRTRATALGVASLRVRNPVQLSYLVDIRDSARRLGTSGWWSRPLEIAIARNRLILPLKKAFKSIRTRTRKRLVLSSVMS